MTWIITTPFQRSRSGWIRGNDIDASTPCPPLAHPLITTNADHNTSLQEPFYEKVGLDIVTETVFCYPYAYITEKTLRPLACKRMLIMVGAPGTLELLHRQGFETFGDFIDESYDMTKDPHDRFHKIVAEINRFVARPIEEIREYYRANQDRFEHNFQHLMGYPARELERLKEMFPE